MSRITETLNDRRSIAGDTALRLTCCIDRWGEFWPNLQKLCELRLAERTSGPARTAADLGFRLEPVHDRMSTARCGWLRSATYRVSAGMVQAALRGDNGPRSTPFASPRDERLIRRKQCPSRRSRGSGASNRHIAYLSRRSGAQAFRTTGSPRSETAPRSCRWIDSPDEP